MKNANAPAMPIVDEEQSFPLNLDRYGENLTKGKFAAGLTKREMMAMHFHAALLSAHSDGVWSVVGCGAAELAVKEADSLLAELEKQQ